MRVSARVRLGGQPAAGQTQPRMRGGRQAAAMSPAARERRAPHCYKIRAPMLVANLGLIISFITQANVRQRAACLTHVREGRMFHASLSVPEPHDQFYYTSKNRRRNATPSAAAAVPAALLPTVTKYSAPSSMSPIAPVPAALYVVGRPFNGK